MKFLQCIWLVTLSCVLMGCREKTPVVRPDEPNKFFVVRGVVRKVEAEAKSVTVAHEKIPGFMDAMTMPFKVKDIKELDGLKEGDTIWFVLWVAADESWIEKVRKEGAPPQAASPPEREAFRVARDVQPLQVGDMMPNYAFTNEMGRTIHLGDYRGQALAFTFIFTRCPLPDFCPRMSRNFAEVAQKLSNRTNGPTNWHLLSISFDPHFDTPEVLQGYAKAFQPDSNHWNFVTGAMIDIDSITDQFELTIVKRGNEWDHKMRTVVVDASGRVQNIIYGNEWKPDTLVEEIVKATSAKISETEEPKKEGPK